MAASTTRRWSNDASSSFQRRSDHERIEAELVHEVLIDVLVVDLAHRHRKIERTFARLGREHDAALVER
ncbi:hypothetical protein, partial [Caballeronia sp. M23-90]